MSIQRLLPAFAILLTVLLSSAPARSADNADRPNILLCVADDWGWPAAGAYGDRVIDTAAFDRVAREGVLFDRAFVSSPSCTPSRNALITGQQFYRLGEGANLHSTLDPKYPNFVRLLEQAGYATAHWRKAWGPGDWKAAGYQRHPCGPEMTFDQFMKQRPTDKPFFFWLGAFDPHRPYDTGSGKASGIDTKAIHVPPYFADNEITRSDIADYYFEVQRFNRDVADALKLLEASGLMENTIIVMSGDNGMPFPRCKANLYDWGVRVPLAIRWPGGVSRPGRRESAFVSFTDLAPTFLDAAGVNVPGEMTGRSLLPLLNDDGKGREGRDFVVVGRERHAAAQPMPSLDGYPARAIRTDHYLFIMNLDPDRWPVGAPKGGTHAIDTFPDCDPGPTKQFILDHRDDPAIRPLFELDFAKRPAEELYDVQADQYELKNLAADPAHADTLKQMRDKLTIYLRETGDPRFTGGPVEFDDYPYRDNRTLQRIQNWKAGHPS